MTPIATHNFRRKTRLYLANYFHVEIQSDREQVPGNAVID